MKPDHPAYEQLRLAVEALCTRPEPIRLRLQAAEQLLGRIPASALSSTTEWNLYHRIVAGLVEGGEESDEEADENAIAESLAVLDDKRVIEIALDIFHLFELLAGVAEEGAPWRWPGD